ncbi:glucose 1-dehydrogenase [Aliishimia ponticola]|uniref:Glucose 1-dehydrogenase n=2 Tax=Aliishimia ponticola TaxID=2499833 RepID=A0A4S4ND93_9RHOB|nr:glucose 1-dehydrogenase [Aliishimia ponticola]
MGLEMAKALHTQGATVVISARKQDQLDTARAEIGARAHAVSANMAEKEQIEALVAKTREIAGPIDILVGNAGVNPYYGATSGIPDDAYDKTMEVNVRANQWLANMVVSDMETAGGGAMMFTSSIGAFKASDTLGTYGMSKLALIGLVRNMAMEWGPLGVRVNAICPGLVKTDFARALWDDPKTEERINKSIPLRRLGEPDDFGGVAVFLASDASKYVTGQALTVCGGSSMWA